MTLPRILLFILILVITGVGLSRLRFQTDLTAVLPNEVAQVNAVKSFHQYFSDDHQMVVHVTATEDKVYGEDISALSEFLEGKFPETEVVNGSEKDPRLFARETGQIWALLETTKVEDFTNQLRDEDALRQNLRQIKEDIQNSFQSGKAISRSYDPVGFFSHHPGLAEMLDSDYSFESDDGQSRFFFLKRPASADWGYKEEGEWVESVREQLAEWNADYDGIFRFGLTGGPVYNSEVGEGMQKDMLGTVSVTLILITLLFLVVQRSFSQLLVLILSVGVTFLLTLGVAGWIMPEMNVLSVSFAAILLGLIIDYVVVILREGRHFPPDRKEIRKALRGSILWAAFSTALVFSVLLLSSFPGVTQLGGLVVIGLSIGALVMLWMVPWFLEKGKKTDGLRLRREARRGMNILMLPLLLILGSILLLWLKGSPPFHFSLSAIQPKSSEAARVQNTLTEKFSSWSDLRTVVFIQADSAKELKEKLITARAEAHRLQEKGLLTDSQFPADLVPMKSSYAGSIAALKGLEKDWPRIMEICAEEGFTEEALKFDDAIFKEILSLPDSYEAFTQLPKKTSMTSDMMAEYEGRYYFRGNVTLSSPLEPAHLEDMRLLNADGITMTGWGTLSATLQPLVQSDFKRIFLPAVGVIFLGLGIVFRNWKETLLVLLILITSLITVNALMVLAGVSWNFLNCIAFPLIVGIGIDYSIHLIFSMRRQEENQQSIWRGVGLAIGFCGLSSVIGFTSLTTAQNELLKSLGWICAVGVFITMFLSLLILPPVWRAWCLKKSP